MSTTPTEPSAERAALAELERLATIVAQRYGTTSDLWCDFGGAITSARAARATPSLASTEVPPKPCGNRDYCGRFPFCGCGGPDPLPERDPSKPAEKQGLFRKFEVKRTDGSSAPGGKHEGCEYFVLDTKHDPHATVAMAAYADAVEATHPSLAADMRERYDLSAAPSPAEVPAEPVAWNAVRAEIRKLTGKPVGGWSALLTAVHNFGEACRASPSVPQAVPQAALDAAVAAERERCAKLCEQEHQESGEHPEMALHCAERIRGLRS